MLLPLVCISLLMAPLPLGANRVWAWTVLGTVLFALVSTWALAGIGQTRRTSTSVRPVMTAMLIWLLYGTLYVLPLPAPVVEFIAPNVYDAYNWAYDLVATPRLGFYLTLDRQATLHSILKYAMYWAAFFLVTVLISNRNRLKLMLYTLVAAGVVQAVLIPVARIMGVELIPWELLDGDPDALRGTFVNRNHFAEFLAMTGAVGIGLSLANMRRSHSGSSSFKARVADTLNFLDGPVVVPGGAVILIIAGMVMSTSRGGIAALFVALVLVLVLSFVARGRGAREMMLFWPIIIVALAGVFWSGARDLVERLIASGLGAGERWIQWENTRALISDHWLTGAGPGTYQYAFTAYKDPALRPNLYEHAHNDYLELLAEQGVVGAILLGLVVVMVMYRLIRAFMIRRDPLIRGALFASLTGMLAMLVHGFVSFNFQIPVNALYFWVLAGTGLAATHLDSKRHDSYGSKPHTGSKRSTERERGGIHDGRR